MYQHFYKVSRSTELFFRQIFSIADILGTTQNAKVKYANELQILKEFSIRQSCADV
jgi:hypothetical protein